MSIEVEVDGVQLMDPAGRWFVTNGTAEPTAPDVVVNVLPSVGGVGEWDAPSPSHGAAQWELVVGYLGEDYAQVQQYRAELEASLLARHREVTVAVGMSGWWREARGRIIAAQATRVGRGSLVTVAYTLRIPSGRWTDTVEQAVLVSAGDRVSGTAADGEYVLSALTGGSRDMDPIITVTAAGVTEVTVTDVESGQWVRVDGDVTGDVVVDPLRFTATVGGVPMGGLLDFSPRPMHLSPGARVRVTRNDVQPVTVRARRSY